MTDADRNPPERPPAPAARASSISRRAASGSKRRGAVVWQLLAFAVLLPVASLSIFRAVPAEWPTPVVQLLSFTPWLALPSAAAMLLAFLGRSRWQQALTAALLVCQAFWLFPFDIGRPAANAAGATVELKVMNINSEFGQADAAEIVRLVRENGIGLLTIQEHSQGLQDRLSAEGLDGLLPNRISNPTDDAGGSAVYSRYPVEQVGLIPDTAFAMPTVRLRPEADGNVAVLEVTNVHALPPVDVRVDQWRSDLAAVGRLAERPGNRLLIGDFNATLDHSEFRDILNGVDGPGLVDVGAASGSRLVPTWPMDGQLLPGITIDHLVTSPALGSSGYQVHRVAGTDHAAVLATLAVPAS
jgi:endonuclease/exonuclease/phosphatase (EEP) superfamily protein YafD